MSNSKDKTSIGSKKRTIFSQANAALRMGKYDDAIKLYNETITHNPMLKEIVTSSLELAKKKALKKHSSKDKATTLEKKQPEKLLSNCNYRLENTTKNFATGWAIDESNIDTPVVIEVRLDGKPYSIIESHMLRNDVKNAFGGEGFYGYRAELSEYASFSEASIVTAMPISHTADQKNINNAAKPYLPILKGTHFKEVNKAAFSATSKYLKKVDSKPLDHLNVSIVILNLNGEKVLKDCINSILKYNKNSEIIIVDHASTDNSVKILESFNNTRIKIIQRDKNYSYSDSNNLGASQATGDIIIFLNNDIILTSDSINAMASIVDEGEYGLLGLKLWDLPRSEDFCLSDSVKVEQHLAVNFRGLKRSQTIEAFEVRNNSFIDLSTGILETPAVTAAVLAVKKDDFFSINGFSDQYFYGQEDVDFCLRFSKEIDKKTGVMLDHGAYHIRGLSRKTLSTKNREYISNNRKTLQQKLGGTFRKDFRVGQFEKPGFWNQKPFSVAMIVSEVGFDTDKADFFTAKELGDAFEDDAETVVGYFDTKSDYDVSGYDIVIVYIDGFDPRRLKNVSPHCIIIGWARNWFDRWCDRVWIEHYDMLYASSSLAQDYMSKRLKRSVGLLRIAASNECLKNIDVNKKYKSDYVFTGSYFDSPREITDALKPDQIPFKFKLFGHNWDKLPHFGKFSSGPVSYKEIPEVYGNTKLVVDDANIATKKWGALNCRLYDALAAGVLCITNNEIGVKEIFGNDFPVYSSNDINKKIINLLSNPKDTKTLVKKYQEIVRKEHTYKNRKDQILGDINSIVRKNKIAIKIAAPDFERAIKWGDYHFAIDIRKELEFFGYRIRIDCLDQWYGDRSLDDDVNIVIRGLDRFKTREDQINILWIISHSDMVCEAELREYNKIYVASDLYSKKLKKFTEIENIEFLPQASSFKISELEKEVIEETPSHEILFIGSSRNEYRNVVRWCIEEKLPISVYGGGWDNFIPKEYIKGDFVNNDLIPYYYNKAKVVLNDHWDDMRRNGFISNRVFDVCSVNGTILTDYVEGIENLNLNSDNYFHNKQDFIEKAINLIKNTNLHSDKSSTPTQYSFKNRCRVLSKYIEDVSKDQS